MTSVDSGCSRTYPLFLSLPPVVVEGLPRGLVPFSPQETSRRIRLMQSSLPTHAPSLPPSFHFQDWWVGTLSPLKNVYCL
jgi:hypothetical protein